MEKIIIAAISIKNWYLQPERSLRNIHKWARRASEQGAELILFPENSITGHLTHPAIRGGAQTVPGPATDRLAEIAREVKAVLCCGLIEKEHEMFYNTQVLVGPAGLIGKQRKLHIPDLEEPFWQGGDEVAVFDLGKVRVGITVCRDSFFSELVRTLYIKGAEVLLMPFGYGTNPRSRYLEEHIHGVVIRAECWSSGFFGVMCNSAGKRPPSPEEPNGAGFPGWAGIISPFGEALTFTRQRGCGEEMVVMELDPKLQEIRRGQYNCIARGLRPELYCVR